MQTHKVTVDVDSLKPEIKALRSIKEIPIDTTPDHSYREHRTIITAKIDGEFTIFVHTPEHTYTVNKWGTLRTDYPAVNEAREALLRLGGHNVVLKSELHAVKENSRDPVQLHEFLSLVKGENADPDRIRLAFWDIVSIDGGKPMMSYADRLRMLGYWFIGREYCYEVPYIKPDDHDDIKTFWDEYVEERGYEGIVAHVAATSLYDRFDGGELYKVKPELEVDAVIIALNKTKVYREQKVGSVKTALMRGDGWLVELSDVSIPAKRGLREMAWGLKQHLISEDKQQVWIRPEAVITIVYNETILAEKQTWKFVDGQYIKGEKMKFVSLKHPRLTHFRPDKEVNPTDLRLSQIDGFP